MKRLAFLCALGVVAGANAAPIYWNGTFTANSPVYNNGTGVAGVNNAYQATLITVSVTGNYTLEMASPNTATSGSNALDTYLRVFASTWTPANGITGALASSDDFTGSLTVLPGPYAGTISSTATGFTGAQPSSRIASVALTQGLNYYVVNTSFREVSYAGSGTNGLGVGPWYFGMDGPGTVTIVPEPATMAVLGLGALALVRRRRK